MRKACTWCNQVQLLGEYPSNKSTPDGTIDMCRSCVKKIYNGSKTKRSNRNRELKRKYGLSIEEYEVKLKEQDCVCAICKQPSSDLKSLAVDHDHTNGKIRGLLCSKCNLGIGNLEDNPEHLINAKRYIEEYKVKDKENQ